MNYLIGGISLEINIDDFKQIYILEPFEKEINYKDIQIQALKVLKIKRPKQEPIFVEDTVWYEDELNFKIYLLNPKNKNKYLAIMVVDKSWKQATIYYKDKRRLLGYTSVELLIFFAYRNLIISKGGFILHSSSICAKIGDKEVGIAFSAESGTGKSTQTRLWEEHKKAKIINDDCPLIMDNKIYGIPWSGSSKKYSDTSMSFDYLVVIKRSKEDKAYNININEALSYIIPRIMLPYQDKNLMNKALELVYNQLTYTKVVVLECTPNKSAVEILYNHISGLITKI
jgi:hypothetical protein